MPEPGGKGSSGSDRAKPPKIIHASCVAVSGRGLLVLGASGSGKSSLALALMGRGARLVADDRVLLTTGKGLCSGLVMANPPSQLRGLIEARGIGLLNAEFDTDIPVELVVDLDRTETARLPEPRTIEVLNKSLVLLHKVESPHFPDALIQYLRMEKRE